MKYKAYMPFVLILGGCAAMEALGLYDSATGEPTDTANFFSDMLAGLTGINAIALWKAGEAILTKRGRENLKNFGSKSSGFVSSLKSGLAIVAGTASPPEAQAKINGTA